MRTLSAKPAKGPELAGQGGVIAGASRGIGRALARVCRREGLRLALSARGAKPLAALASELDASGRDVVAIPGDVSDRDYCTRLIAEDVAEATVSALGLPDRVSINTVVLRPTMQES